MSTPGPAAPSDAPELTEHSPLLNRHVSFRPQLSEQQPPSPMSEAGTASSSTAVQPGTDQQPSPAPTPTPTPAPPPTPTPAPIETPIPAPSPEPSSAPDMNKPSSTQPSSSDHPTSSIPPTPAQRLPKADTNLSWGGPAGLHLRSNNDESLQIFRRALGINTHLGMPGSGSSTSLSPGGGGSALESGRRPTPGGIYASVLDAQRRKAWSYAVLSALIYACHFGQIIIGAGLTALGPAAGEHTLAITALGAVNTIIAGVLALMKGNGLPERLGKDKVEFSRLQDWIEETEALLAVGVIGRNRKEVGLLVEVAFKKYNAAKASVDNNRPENYVRQIAEGDDDGRKSGSSGSDGGGTGNTMVSLNLPKTQ